MDQTTKKWGRKQKVSLQTMIFLVAGLAISAWAKLDYQLYLAYVIGVTGGSLGFMWGNSQEYKYGKPTTPTPE